jgi:hypothetical protein
VTTPRPASVRRSALVVIAAAISLVAGIAIILATLLSHSFSRAEAGEKTTDFVRSELTAEGLARHRRDFEAIRDGVNQLFDEAIPSFALALDMTNEELRADIQESYPAVAVFAPPDFRTEGFAFAEKVLVNLESHRLEFQEADRIPVGWLPISAGPWIAVAGGGLLVLLGLLSLLRPGPGMLWPVALLGLSLAAGPFLVGFPHRADAAASLLESLKFTPEIVTHTRDLFDAGEAALHQLEETVFPDLATELGLTGTELDGLIAAQFPAIDAARADVEGILRRYEHRVEIREQGLTLIPRAQAYPLRAVTWWAVVPGAMILLASGAALAVTRLRRPAPPPAGPSS